MTPRVAASTSPAFVRRLLAIDAAIVAALALRGCEPISARAVGQFVEEYLPWAMRVTIYERLELMIESRRVTVRRYEGRVYVLHSLPNPAYAPLIQ